MKKIIQIISKVLFLLLTSYFLLLTASAQSPEKMSYQAVIRDAGNHLVTTQIGMRISILQGTSTGTAVYIETQTPTPNANGLVTIEINGLLSTVTFGPFSAIDWSDGPYFIKTETAVASPLTTYTIEGTSQLLSVPYALHAKTVTSFTETDPLYTGSQAAIITASDITNLSNLSGTNTGDQDLSGKVDKATGKDLTPNGTTPGQMQYWDGSAWVTVAPGSAGQVLKMVNGVPTWGGVVSAGTDEVQNPITGAIWMDRNLGATQVATSRMDANSYGHLYQWGRGTDGHQIRTSGATTTLSSSDAPGHANFISPPDEPYDWRSPQNDNLWQGVNGTNNPCPNGYRLPTEAEWSAEFASWSSTNLYGAFDSPLKLTVAGYRHVTDFIDDVEDRGHYWSSTVSSADSRYLFFSNSAAGMFTKYRASGLSVRCIKD